MDPLSEFLLNLWKFSHSISDVMKPQGWSPILFSESIGAVFGWPNY